MTRTFISITILLISASVFQCARNSISGTGTLVGNPTAVTGVLYNTDESAAVNVTVHIRKKNSLPDISALQQGKKQVSALSVTTNDNGVFSFDTSLDTGTYTIEAVSDTNAVMIDSVQITDKDSTLTLPPDTLKPTGSFRGTVILPELNDTSEIYLSLYGINRYTVADTNGVFEFTALAQGVYTLRISTNNDSLLILDTAGIQVFSAETIAIDTISIPPAAIIPEDTLPHPDTTSAPRPFNVTSQYNPFSSTVSLHWYISDMQNTRGFNIYRKEEGSPADSGVLLNNHTVRGTIFFDTTVTPGQSYEYSVASLSLQEKESEKSLPTILTAAYDNAPPTDTLHPVFSNDIAIAPNGDIYIASMRDGCVYIYTSDMHLKGTLDEEETTRWPLAITIDEQGTIFIINARSDATIRLNINVYNPLNQFLDSLTDISYAAVDILTKDSSLYVIDTSYIDGSHNSILACSYDGTRKKLIRQGDEDRYTCLAKGNGDTLFVSAGENILVMDTTGTLLSTIPVSSVICPHSLVYDRYWQMHFFVERIETDGFFQQVVHAISNDRTDTNVYTSQQSAECIQNRISLAVQKSGNILMGTCMENMVHFTPVF